MYCNIATRCFHNGGETEKQMYRAHGGRAHSIITVIIRRF